MMNFAESKVKSYVKSVCASLGAFADMPGASQYGNSGRADFIIDYNGVVFRIETKANSKRKLDPAQKGYRNEVRKRGGIYLIINAENMHMVGKILTRLSR